MSRRASLRGRLEGLNRIVFISNLPGEKLGTGGLIYAGQLFPGTVSTSDWTIT